MFCQTTNSGEKNILETNMNKVFLECLLYSPGNFLSNFLTSLLRNYAILTTLTKHAFGGKFTTIENSDEVFMSIYDNHLLFAS